MQGKQGYYSLFFFLYLPLYGLLYGCFDLPGSPGGPSGSPGRASAIVLPLCQAIDRGDLCEVKELLNKGADPEEKDPAYGKPMALVIHKLCTCTAEDGEIYAEIKRILLIAIENKRKNRPRFPHYEGRSY